LGWLEEIAKQLLKPHVFLRNTASDLVTDCLLREIGDGLRLHHCFSKEPFAKDKFEYLMERSCNLCGFEAQLAPKGNPGHDISIQRQRFSLKTQADKNVKPKFVYISKYMELGKGEWGDKDEDLIGLRERFFGHLESYDRILVLRTLSRPPMEWEYELMEVPKALLKLAAEGRLEMMHSSRQMPKPGNCFVSDNFGRLLFKLYFDGGTERKLQIKAIDISNCLVHARWRFPSNELVIEA
jgi:type II restriction enzyme